MPAPILIDLSHTSHTAARTGIQRVTRNLWGALRGSATPAGGGVRAVTFDPYLRQWRCLEEAERRQVDRAGQAGTAAAGRRGAHWPLGAKLRGTLGRWTGLRAMLPEEATGLIVPEVFSPAVARALPALRRRVRGPAVALFHDAIALRLPEMSAARTVARFPAYLMELATFDGVAAVSEASREELVAWWRWAGVKAAPPVVALPLGVEAGAEVDDIAGGPASLQRPDPECRRPPEASPKNPVEVLCVSTIEARKNHLALLDAAEALWGRGYVFRLRLVGLAQRETGGPALERIRALQNQGRDLVYDGPIDDASLEAAYAAAAFTVYPSLAEGFGLPVAESLRHGRPCIASGRGAVGEIGRGGGCLTVDTPDAASLTDAMARLLQHPEERAVLARAAARRTFKSPAAHSQELLDWMAGLK